MIESVFMVVHFVITQYWMGFIVGTVVGLVFGAIIVIAVIMCLDNM